MGHKQREVASALSYLNTHWLETANYFEGNFGNPYAMWAVYKGLELMIGKHDMAVITNLHPDPGNVDNSYHGWNWWEAYCEFLVGAQQPAGNWIGHTYWPQHLATPWYINILAGIGPPPPPSTFVDIKPGSCPNLISTRGNLALAVAIVGTADFDVSQIDPATVVITREGIDAEVFRRMVRRYTKFSIDNLSAAASRMENGRGGNVIQLSRFSHTPEKEKAGA